MDQWKNELTRISHRRYTEGFFAEKPGAELQYLADSAYLRSDRFCALVRESQKVKAQSEEFSEAWLLVKDKLEVGKVYEVIGPGGAGFATTLLSMRDEAGASLEQAHPGTKIRARCRPGLQALQILRRRVD